MRICWDIDETLCTGTYTPLLSNIDILRRLKQEGHTIILYTARGMGRSASNQGLAIAKIGLLTLTQLEEWGVPYDEIYFGKPSADIYIDDKAIASPDALYKLLEKPHA